MTILLTTRLISAVPAGVSVWASVKPATPAGLIRSPAETPQPDERRAGPVVMATACRARPAVAIRGYLNSFAPVLTGPGWPFTATDRNIRVAETPSRGYFEFNFVRFMGRVYGMSLG